MTDILDTRDFEIKRMLGDAYRQCEIARKLGISQSAVAQRISKIRRVRQNES